MNNGYQTIKRLICRLYKHSMSKDNAGTEGVYPERHVRKKPVNGRVVIGLKYWIWVGRKPKAITSSLGTMFWGVIFVVCEFTICSRKNTTWL